MMELHHGSGGDGRTPRTYNQYSHMALRQFDCETTAHAAEGSPDPLDVVRHLIHTTIPSPMGLVIEGRCLHIVALKTSES